MQLKSSFPLGSTNSWEKLQGANSLYGIGITQRDYRSLELTQERYFIIQCCKQPNRIVHQPAADHPPHIMGTLGPHEEKRKVWWARVQFCATVTFCITMKLAKKATGRWWRELSQLHTPKHTISFSGLPWRMCRRPFVFVWQTMVIPQLFGNSRASIWTAMNGRPR